MKIYTKSGDKGQTSLFGGARVSKNHPRLAAYGGLDELNACLGVFISNCQDQGINQALHKIQHQLFHLGSHLATEDENQRQKLPTIEETWITDLENLIDQWQEQLPELKNFILPGGSIDASFAHLARTICRRVERSCIELDDESAVDEKILIYLNRLSDFLFVLARRCNQLSNTQDVIWKP